MKGILEILAILILLVFTLGAVNVFTTGEIHPCRAAAQLIGGGAAPEAGIAAIPGCQRDVILHHWARIAGG